MKKSICLNCDNIIDESTMYCEHCYKQLCIERKNSVIQYVKEGRSFNKACKIVADKYEIDIEDVKFLFIN